MAILRSFLSSFFLFFFFKKKRGGTSVYTYVEKGGRGIGGVLHITYYELLISCCKYKLQGANYVLHPTYYRFAKVERDKLQWEDAEKGRGSPQMRETPALFVGAS